jgi:hypothetical protein
LNKPTEKLLIKIELWKLQKFLKKTLNFIFLKWQTNLLKKYLSDEQTYEKKFKCQNPDGRFSLNKRKQEPANTLVWKF